MKLKRSGKRIRSITAMALAMVLLAGMVPGPVAAASGDTYTVNVSSVNVRSSASKDSKVLTMASRGSNVEVIGSDGSWYKVKFNGETGYIRKDMLVEGASATSSSSSATATVTGSSVNIRKTASTSSSVLKRAEKGTKLTAISISDGWVKVSYSGVTGYVSADFVKVSGLSSSSGSSASLSEMDKEGVINASEVNVREGASTSSDKAYSLSKGAEVDVTGLKGDWYRVHTSKGTGYVLAKYVTIKSSSSSTASDSSSSSLTDMDASGTVSGNGVNVRKSASTSSSKVYSLDKGDKVTVTGKQGDWYKVKTSSGSGFVLSKYISVSSSSSSSSSSSTSVKDLTGAGTITGSGVNVRKDASKSSDALYKLDNGTQVTITGKAGDWYRISTSKGSGFVMKDFVDVLTSESNSIKQGDDSDDVKAVQSRLIELGYLSGKADGDFGDATKAAVKAFQKRAGLTADGVVGATTLAALNSSSAPKATSSATAKPTATAKPSENSYSTLKQGSNGESVKTLQKRLIELKFLSGSADGDYGTATTDAVKTFQKQIGITADGVAGSSTQKAIYASDAPSKKTEADKVEEAYDSISSTLSMGDSGSQVKTLQKRLISLDYLSGSADGNFGAKTRTAVMIFQKQTGLTVDGKAGKTTVNKLFSSSADKYDGKTTINTSSGSGSSGSSSSGSSSGSSSSSGTSSSSSKVKMMDWWTSGIQSIFSRGTIATVTDVKTGISWKVKRRGGTNHADVEPLTAADTAKMKQAYGGSWSWTRRPIWVTIDGVKYAASMNGMPHGVQGITNNNFSGHHCIHFLNSRTHTGNRLDSDHQAAVKYAYNAGK